MLGIIQEARTVLKKVLYNKYRFWQTTKQMFSMVKLTQRQSEILKFLRDTHQYEGTTPTYREIAARFGFKSPKAAADHVYALEKKGYIRRNGGRSRGIELLPMTKKALNETITVPILGSIPAGTPEDLIEHSNGALSLDKILLGTAVGDSLFALKVNGDSMEGRGIYNGDWVIADADMPPNVGNVVVALIDGQNTLKTLAKQKRRFFLKAENPKYSELIPMQEMMIQGVVKAIFRRMH